MRKYRVIQMGTGNTGIHALRGIIQHPDLELVGLWVHSDQKAGKDAGELCGLGHAGIPAIQNIESLMAMEADCVGYMKAAPSDKDFIKQGSYAAHCIDEICAFLESGKNVVGTAGASLVYPYIWGNELVGRIEKACQKGRSSFLWRGIEPGFMCDEFPLLLTSLSHRVDSIHGTEILCYAEYKEPVALSWMGFGHPLPDEAKRKKLAEAHAVYTKSSVQMIADALRVKLDEIHSIWEGEILKEDIEVAIGTIKAGTVGVVRYQVDGTVGGKSVIAVEHVNRLRDDLAPQWAQIKPGGYRVIIEGTPPMKIEVTFIRGAPEVEACVATSARLVNSIPVLCDSSPGIHTFLDLPRPVMGVHRMKVD